jgi:hypothetical protein
VLRNLTVKQVWKQGFLGFTIWDELPKEGFGTDYWWQI